MESGEEMSNRSSIVEWTFARSCREMEGDLEGFLGSTGSEVDGRQKWEVCEEGE